MTLHCYRCKAARPWAKVLIGTWTHLPGVRFVGTRYATRKRTQGVWDLQWTQAIECACGIRREAQRPYRLLAPRKDHYDLPKV